MNALIVRTSVLLMAVSITLAGCDRTDSTPAPPAVAAPAGDAAQVETYVQARFQSDDAIRAHDIDVSATGGRVTLRGAVPTEDARQRAVAAASGVAGVESVDDRLVVGSTGSSTSPPSTTAATDGATPATDPTIQPGWITTKIQAQFFVEPAISPWDIDVTTASNGMVTLRGRVDDATVRDEAVRIAKATAGVTGVNDRLTIAPASAARDAADGVSEPDPWITAKIQSKYFLDAEVKGREIDVDTQNGVVTLRGSVGSEMEKRQAIAIARNTDGVREVQDQLAIAPTPPASGETGLARAADAVDDAWVTLKVQSKFFLDPDIKGSAIDVTTREGVVTLAGTVDSPAARQAAEQIAKETGGVSRVLNQLAIDTTK